MTWERALSIALAVAIFNVWRVYRDRWKARLAARTEIPCYRDWRGRYVPDLHLIRFRRAVLIAWVILFFTTGIWGYFIIHDVQLPQ